MTLILIKTTPAVIQIYKTIYNRIINNNEKITEMIKAMAIADIKIKTDYIDPKKQYNEKVKELFKYQRKKLGIGE